MYVESSNVKKILQRSLPALILLVFTFSEADLGAQQIKNAFNKAVYEGQFETVRLMVDENPSLDLDTSLIQALNGKQDEIARFLLQRGADPNGGIRPGRHVYAAARNHNKAMIEYLVGQGASVDAEAEKNTFLISTPLTHAVFDGDIDAVRLLLDAGANVNHINAGGYTALLHAIGGDRDKKHELIRLLLVNGANPDLEGGLGLSPRLAAEAAEQNELLSLFDEFKPQPEPQKLPDSEINYTLDDLASGDVVQLLHGKFEKLHRFSPDEGFYLIGMTPEPERITCHSMKQYMNGFPHSDVNFLVGICGQGPFDSNNINNTIKLSGIFLKHLYKEEEASEEQRKLFGSMTMRESTMSNTEDVYSFVMTAVGHGVAFFPTGVIIDRDTATSLVVQFIDPNPNYLDTGNVEAFTRSVYRLAKSGTQTP
jgi:hypothetical protein